MSEFTVVKFRDTSFECWVNIGVLSVTKHYVFSLFISRTCQDFVPYILHVLGYKTLDFGHGSTQLLRESTAGIAARYDGSRDAVEVMYVSLGLVMNTCWHRLRTST